MNFTETLGRLFLSGNLGHHVRRLGLHAGSGQHVADIVMDLTCDACAFGEPRMLQVRRPGGFDIGETSARTADTFPLVVCQRLEAPLSSLRECEYPAAENCEGGERT